MNMSIFIGIKFIRKLSNKQNIEWGQEISALEDSILNFSFHSQQKRLKTEILKEDKIKYPTF